MNESPAEFYDYTVIGGGPGGSTLAAMLAEGGRSVLVLEAAKFPRFTVGEIVAPTALWRVWHRLGVSQDTLDRLFVRKWNGAWQAPNGTEFRFEQDVHPDDQRCHPFVYNLERAVYDEYLVSLARERGATVLEEARVTEIIHNDAGRVTGVEFSHDGRVHRVSTRLVIDASGRANFLGRKLGLRMEHEELKGFSVFAHYEGARRVEGDPEGDIRLIFDQDMWFWWAPLKSPKTSVGVVANRERYWEEYAADPEGFYERHLQRCDYIRERVADAQRVTEIRPVSANGSSYAGYHYTCAELLGDGWALVGDAAGFVDPIFSAGLFVTQTAAWWLAEALLELDADAWPTRAQLQPYADRCKREFAEALDHIKRFATYYFDPRFVDFFLSLGSRKPELRKLYIDTFIAYEPKAIIEFGRLMERMQRMSRHAPAVEVSRSL